MGGHVSWVFCHSECICTVLGTCVQRVSISFGVGCLLPRQECRPSPHLNQCLQRRTDILPHHVSSQSPLRMGVGWVICLWPEEGCGLHSGPGRSFPGSQGPLSPPPLGVHFPPLLFPHPSTMPAITLASMKYLPNVAFCKYPFGYCPLVGNINCVPHAS